MTDKERLVELLRVDLPCWDEDGNYLCPGCEYKDIQNCIDYKYADHLIAHGVVVQKRGRWVFEEDEKHPWCDKAICTHCKKVIACKQFLALDVGKEVFIEEHPVCPNCGAKMDLKEGE